MTNRLVVKKSDSLAVLESLAKDLCDAGQTNADMTLHLPIDFGPQFLKESWMIGLVATAHNLGISTQKPRLDTPENGYTSLVVFAQNLYHQLSNSVAGGRNGDGVGRFLGQLIAAGGILALQDSGRALTICAVDPYFPTPFVLGVGDLPNDVKSSFAKLRRNQFEVGDAAGFSEKYPDSAGRLDEFVCEIYQNTLHHGRFDSNNVLIPGMRFIRIRRHIGHKRQAFLDRASGFPELQRYIESTVRSDTTHTLLEISVGDRGIGLVDRLVATRQDLKQELLKINRNTRLGAINHIIRAGISSRTNSPGSGDGLTNALFAVAKLRGFVSLRTGTEWAYRDFSTGTPASDSSAFKSRSGNDALLSVAFEGELAPLVGTYFSVLIPVGQQ